MINTEDVVRLYIEYKGDVDGFYKFLEDLLEGMVQTKVHHVDLHDFEPDADELSDKEEFTPPAGKRKKTTKVEKSNAEAQRISK